MAGWVEINLFKGRGVLRSTTEAPPTAKKWRKIAQKDVIPSCSQGVRESVKYPSDDSTCYDACAMKMRDKEARPASLYSDPGTKAFRDHLHLKHIYWEDPKTP